MKQIRNIIIIILLTSAIWSCGVRKVNKTEMKETITEKSVETITDNTHISDSLETNEITFEPIDNSKEFIVNGKKHFNVKIKQSKVKRNTNTQKDIKASKIKDKHAKKVIEVKQKETEKKYNWWWLLIPIGLAYLFYKFKKDNILF